VEAGFGDDFLHLAVERLDDFGRRVFPTPEPTSSPGRPASAMVGTSGNERMRPLPAAASARSLPS
jgi:hypothetical protein